MGEAKRRGQKQTLAVSEALGVETAGGRVQVRWDDQAAATPFGQMVFFIEFLTLTGLLDHWVENCPLAYHGAHRSSQRDILGTWLLSMLSGHRRYAHIAAIRADGVSADLLGMSQVVSEDTVRRALKALDETAGTQWLQGHLDASIQPYLSAPWICDVDVTIKPLYGKQEGAVIGYNPKKPGRPSHAYHTYQMAGLRLILGVDVEPGNETHANHTLPGLLRCLDRLPHHQQPKLVRGDSGFGLGPVMEGLESRQIPYLFKLRLTKNVKRTIQQIFWGEEWSRAGQGWEGREGTLALSGWTKPRRVVVLRRPLRGDLLLADDEQQLSLAFIEPDVPTKRYEYAVLVTDLPHEVLTIAQWYRDRADSENTFDELKNQWGWGGFTTQDLKRCRLSAMGVALVYNWWSLFVRLTNPKARREAITSRPFLLSGVGRKTTHAGQKHLVITALHGEGQKAMAMLTSVSRLLKTWQRIAEQSPLETIWQQACAYLAKLITGVNWLRPLECLLLGPPDTG